MPYRIEPVPVPRQTRINLDDATPEDRLVIVLKSGHQMVFQTFPPFPVIDCDLERSSPQPISALARALWETRKRVRLNLPFRTPELTLEDVESDLWVTLSTGLKYPVVTAEQPLYVGIQSKGLRLRYYEVPGGPIDSITSTTVDQLPEVQ